MAAEWKSPWEKHEEIKATGEMTPFIFRGTEYRLVNVPNKEAYECYPAAMPSKGIHDDHFIIYNVAEDRIMSAPLYNSYFGSAFVYGDRVYCFCADYELDRPWWHCRRLLMISSDDLVTWTRPKIVLEGDPGERLFNTSVTFDGKKFIMLYENSSYHPFTFKFAESDDLENWTKIPDAVYGKEKYVGGPTLEFFGGYYYVTYVNIFKNEETGKNNYDTRIARSRDLVSWEDSPHSVLMPPYDFPDPERPDLQQTNASDAEFLEKDGKTYAFWCGGNQETAGFARHYRSEYSGTLRQLFESFFRQ